MLSAFLLISGVSHADELIYLFIFPFPSVPPGLNRSETELSKQMLQIWTNFVKLGQVLLILILNRKFNYYA
jgi:hypothetical protein